MPLPPKPICNPHNFPLELVMLSQWVVWGMDSGVKKPYSPHTRRLASSTDKATWGAFRDAYAAYKTGHYAGLGFMLGESSPYVVIDIDQAFDGEELSQVACVAVWGLESYTEVSVSGHGLHIFVRATKPTEDCWRGEKKLEAYSKLRYIAITGNLFQPELCSIRTRQAALDGLWPTWFPEQEPKPVFRNSEYSTPVDASALSDDDLIERGHKLSGFTPLWFGDCSKYRFDQSCADMALCNYLRYLTGCDPYRMDALFRKSGLMRKKWDEKRGSVTYGEITIRRVLK